MNRLQNQATVITGASSGIGRATALLFATHGARLLLTARREDRLKEVATQCRDLGAQTEIHAGDAGLEPTATTAIHLALKTFGRLDLLINNAGQGNYKPITETSAEDFDQLIAANLRSSFLFARHAAPPMIAQRSGTILFISSVAGLQGAANESVYSATKFAQVGLAQSLDAELRPHGIRVGVLHPGGVKSEFALGRGRTAESIAQSHMMDPADVAEAILFAATQPPNTRIPTLTVRHMG